MASSPGITLSLGIVRGSDDLVEFEILNSDKTPKDLTGAVIYSTARSELGADAGTALWQKDSSDITDIELTEPLLGKFVIYFKPADTEAQEVKSLWYWDVNYVLGGKRYAVVIPEDVDSQRKSIITVLARQQTWL